MSAVPSTAVRPAFVLGFFILFSGVDAGPMTAQAPVARFTAMAVSRTPLAPGAGTTSLTFTINRWSTDAERDALMTIAFEKDEKALIAAVREMPRVGSISSFGNVGFEVRYARTVTRPDGLEIVTLLTDRPMSFDEQREGWRSTDYPFTLIELQIGPGSTGEGTLSVAVRIRADRFNKNLVFESYEEPLRLLSAQRLR